MEAQNSKQKSNEGGAEKENLDSKKKSRKETRKSRSRSREIRSPSPPDYSRRRFGGRNRSRERSPYRGRDPRRRERSRTRSRERYERKRPRRSPRRWDRQSISPPPPPAMMNVAPPPPPMIGPPGANYIPQPMYTEAYVYPTAAPFMPNLNNPPPPYPTYDYSIPPVAPVAPVAYPPPMLDQPVPPGEDFVQNTWESQAAANQVPQETEEEKRKREAAVALEVRNQRASLKKQRDDYKKRASALKRELKTLKQQRSGLCSGHEPPSPTTNSFIKENDKLQSQIQNKISTIENVIDMLDGIIGKDKTPTPPPAISTEKKKSESLAVVSGKKTPKAATSSSSTPERLKSEILESIKKKRDISKDKVDKKPEKNGSAKKDEEKVNYIHYDPELHWCQVCDVFPKTAKDYLNHLHSEMHQGNTKVTDFPWREAMAGDEKVVHPDAPTKRTPIRGLQFFVPSTAWYCKVCSFWMGDLHCASLHLKSKTHAHHYNQLIERTPNFEIDWMTHRQKAYERCQKMAAEGKLTPPPIGGGKSIPNLVPPPPQIELNLPQPQVHSKPLFDGIPLQIHQTPVVGKLVEEPEKKEEKKSKKKKSKKDEKKDKKKKKRSKKKKRAASSSSSSSSDSSGSDSDGKGKDDKDSNPIDPANSIRAAMRNILKAQQETKHKEVQQENLLGKWTIVQPAQKQDLTAPEPPSISDNSMKEKKRDELIISQWVIPEPVISDSEKKLLEQLKGKLKKREGSKGRNDAKEDDDRKAAAQREREIKRSSRERDRGGHDQSRDRSRGRVDYDRRDRRRSRSRGRRSRSRSGSFGRRYRRRSYSRSRSRSRSHSWSRNRRVIEKPIVNYPPEPKPKPQKPEKKPKSSKKDDDGEKKERKSTVMTTASGKKLPFIGRMPVFKKQQIENNGPKKEEVAPKPQQMLQKAGPEPFINGVQKANEDFVDDLMPDPFQYVALMGAPPPPPLPMQREDKGEILPPGIDHTDTDSVPKPLSDAPIPRKGPLPKDFQEALDILFDGDKPKPTVPDKKTPVVVEPLPPVNDPDRPQMILPESMEMYGQYAAPYMAYGDQSQNQPLDKLTDVQPAPPPAQPEDDSSNSTTASSSSTKDEPEEMVVEEEKVVEEKVEEESEEMKRKRDELEELAMLGIDVDDMAAQCI